jgi:hypothetical protein
MERVVKREEVAEELLSAHAFEPVGTFVDLVHECKRCRLLYYPSLGSFGERSPMVDGKIAPARLVPIEPAVAYRCAICLDARASDKEVVALCGCTYRVCLSCAPKARAFLQRMAYMHRTEGYPCRERQGPPTPHPPGVIGDFTPPSP